MVEGEPLRHDLIDGNLGRRRSAVIHLLVAPLDPVPGLFYYRRVRVEECTDVHLLHLRVVSNFRLEARLDMAPQVEEDSLVDSGVLYHV